MHEQPSTGAPWGDQRRHHRLISAHQGHVSQAINLISTKISGIRGTFGAHSRNSRHITSHQAKINNISSSTLTSTQIIINQLKINHLLQMAQEFYQLCYKFSLITHKWQLKFFKLNKISKKANFIFKQQITLKNSSIKGIIAQFTPFQSHISTNTPILQANRQFITFSHRQHISLRLAKLQQICLILWLILVKYMILSPM